MIEGHQVLPRDFRLAPTDVRRTAHEDRRQARRVAAHPRYMIGVLHHHHAGDRLLRPKHFQKVPVQLATTLGVVEAQHEAISALLEEVDPLLQRWTADPRAGDREYLADTMTRLTEALDEHLAAGEHDVLPPADDPFGEPPVSDRGRSGRGQVTARVGSPRHLRACRSRCVTGVAVVRYHAEGRCAQSP